MNINLDVYLQHHWSHRSISSEGGMNLGSRALHPECPSHAEQTCGAGLSPTQSVSAWCINSICTNTGLLNSTRGTIKKKKKQA